MIDWFGAVIHKAGCEENSVGNEWSRGCVFQASERWDVR